MSKKNCQYLNCNFIENKILGFILKREISTFIDLFDDFDLHFLEDCFLLYKEQ